MCEFCNGDREKQEPLKGQDEKDWTPILTVIGDKKLLSVIEIEKARESLFPMNYCPMCGRKLEAAHNNYFNLTTAGNDTCTRPDITDCHAKVGTGVRCMNGILCPPLQVK